MLSRVALNIYWLARYLERTENTLRIISTHGNTLMDLPQKGIQQSWSPLLAITGSGEVFYQHNEEPNEIIVVHFLIADERNPGCVLSSLQMVRENLRTTRDMMPSAAWEIINNLYIATQDYISAGLPKRTRHAFFNQIIGGIERFNGFLLGAMTRDLAYDFLELGRHLERADMTTRTLDVRAANLLAPVNPPKEDSQHQTQTSGNPPSANQVELNPYENILWMGVLKSLSAYQMYRRQIKVRVQGADVLVFLLQNETFPRGYRFCLNALAHSLNRLPHNETPLRRLARLQRQIQTADVRALAHSGLHEFIDELQIGLGELHNAIDQAYLSSRIDTTVLS